MIGIFRKLSRSLRGSRERIGTVQQFKAVLERERSRTDRTGCPLAVVTFEVNGFKDEEGRATRLIRTLQWRLRATDEFGLMAAGRIGVVLPDTPPDGAWKLAMDLCEQLGSRPTEFNCQVYQYPDAPDERKEGLRRDDSGRNATAHEVHLGDHGPPRPVRSLVGLFCQPLPTWKRCFDIVGAALGLLILSPLLFAIACAVKFTSPGPCFFVQRRDGLGGKPFAMYKFRTMVVGADSIKETLRYLSVQDGPAIKIVQDPRATRLGLLLRRFSLDELPQLWHVLTGQMSLVGPRPMDSEESVQCEAWQHRRLDVTPGVTGIWQVKGRSQVPFEQWMRMDLQYVRRPNSLAYDLWLLLLTIPAVLRGRGAH